MKLDCIGYFVITLAATSCTLAESRDPKKGLALYSAQTCGAVESHTDSSWWYSWSARNNGFGDSFCDQPQMAYDDARAAGLEFVPMFWGGVPQQPLDSEMDASLQDATYLIAFNEPEMAEQSNIDPFSAAQIWPFFLEIAQQYNLSVVGPCVTDGGLGPIWYSNWEAECKSLYDGEACHTDFTCLHTYYHPYPCTDTKSWSCVGAGASQISNKISSWYNTYGKPIWITEFACPSWGWEDDTYRPCSEADQIALMEQVVPLLDSMPEVFRYSWYNTYDTRWIWNALNEQAWTVDLPKGYGCVNKKWIGGFGDAGWQMQAMHECVAKGDADPDCHVPLALSVDDQNCYCATMDCSCPTGDYENCTQAEYNHGAMETYFEQLGLRETNALSTVGTLYNMLPATSSPTTPSSPITSPPSASPTTASPTKAPTSSPITAPPTKFPTASPTTASPSNSPTSSPTPAPTLVPTTPSPTKPPTSPPTASPTSPPTLPPATTPVTCGLDGIDCSEDIECCSNQCDNSGKASLRTYKCIGASSCGEVDSGCTENNQCCSNTCDNTGKSSDRTYLCLAN